MIFATFTDPTVKVIFIYEEELDDVAVLTFVMQRIVKLSPPHLKEKYGVVE